MAKKEILFSGEGCMKLSKVTDKNCLEVSRVTGTRYSYLEFDFMLCEGTDEYLRRRFIEILRKYETEILELLSSRPKKIVAFFRQTLERAGTEEQGDRWIIPHFSHYPMVIDVGKKLIAFRLPTPMIDRMINEDRVVDLVKEWCKQRFAVSAI